MINLFIEQIRDEVTFPTRYLEYSAGYITKCDNDFVIAESLLGAEETFSIGQPVYDKEHNLMGFLGIGLYNHLDYSTTGLPINERFPVEHWRICLPTEYCVLGKKVLTYWQDQASRDTEE